MNIYKYKAVWKLALFMAAIIIGLLSLIYTHNLVSKLKTEERKKVELWAEATRQLISSADTTQNLEFQLSVIEGNSTVPVIWTSDSDSIISAKNFGIGKDTDNAYLRGRLERMKEKTSPIIINLPDGTSQRIYYRDSTILIRLTYYPYVQLSVIILFILVSYLAFSASRKAEQNQVWVGMSKETAHQLGTPTSSLSGWIEILQMKHPGLDIAGEMSKDISRLERVAERFSKIGARPELSPLNITSLIHQTVDYLRSRSSSKVDFSVEPGPGTEMTTEVNGALLGWVIENVCKNAIDAVEGEGEIGIRATESDNHVIIDITDNGKGIPRASHKKIFSPGFTTKARGWGLGLSLAKRIIEEYHHGKILVRHSEPGRGTCIRIMLKKSIS